MSGTLTSARNAYARARPFAVTILLGAAALTIALAGARAIADIVGPVFLALVLTISLHPIRIWLKRHRFPEWAASVILLLAAYLVLGLLTLALIVSVAQLAELLPQYKAQLTAVVEDAGNTLRSLGVQQEQINAVVKAIDPGQLVAVAGAVLASTLGVLSNVFFLLVLLFFMVGGFHLVDGTAYLAASASIASGGGCGHGPRICSRLGAGPVGCVSCARMPVSVANLEIGIPASARMNLCAALRAHDRGRSRSPRGSTVWTGVLNLTFRSCSDVTARGRSRCDGC